MRWAQKVVNSVVFLASAVAAATTGANFIADVGMLKSVND
jgi:enoyl-[acyl-carrier-protein] reductase (NADH)